jgi:histidinol-phosphate/aromatic aminotransferase/cobyric acid decarboxylase-like protein/choline kinase
MRAGSKLACVLAAGLGSRLKSLTRHNTKCMVEVGGVRLISHLLHLIDRAGFDETIVVVGHGAASLKQHIRSLAPSDLTVHFVENRDFANTNNIYSLHLALQACQDRDFAEIAVFESDVYVAPATAQAYLTSPRAVDSALVSPYEYWMEGTAVTVKANGRIEAFISKNDISRYSYSELYKTVNWYRFSRRYMCDRYMPFLNAYLSVKGKNSYYEDVLRTISPHVTDELTGYQIPASEWVEIDDEEDLRRAEIIASKATSKKVSLLAGQFGGYWKHSDLTDLTLLENPCFPPPGLMLELSRCFDRAVRGYSSKQSIIAGIAAKTLKVESKNLVVGNGASELFTVLFAADSRRCVIVPPHFLDFERLLGRGRLRLLDRTFPHDRLAAVYRGWLGRADENLIIVNPNNPTGEMLDRAFIVDLLDRALSKNRRVVVDESFMDFSGDPAASLLTQEVIDRYPNLVVVKSLGKSHGVGGIRLGLLASSDMALLALLREKLPIWNVSSIAEVYLDLLPKYMDNFNSSMETIRQERCDLLSHVRERGIFAARSSANFLLLPLRPGKGSAVQDAFFGRGFITKTIARVGLAGEWLRLPIKDRQMNIVIADIISHNSSLFMSAAEIGALQPSDTDLGQALQSACDQRSIEDPG